MSGLEGDFADRTDVGAGASARLEEVLQQVPPDRVSVDWILSHFFDRSPEFLFLVFTPVAIVPATSTLAGAVMLIAAVPMMFHHRGFALPRTLLARTIPRVKLERAVNSLLALLKRYEAYALAHPHPPARHHTRLAGFLVAALAASLLVPLPFSNILPGLTIGTVSLASLEQDGRLLLLASVLTTISLLAVTAEALSVFHLAAGIL